MTTPVRVQLRRTKGWRMPENTVSVARPGKFGNPFTKENAIESGYATEDTWPHFVVRCFRDWLTSASGCDWWQGRQSDARLAMIRANLSDLHGKNLACWCALDKPCHADTLLELANPPEADA